MKKTALTIFGVFLALLSYGQTVEDKQAVIQKCIDLEEVGQLYQENESLGKKPLVIFNNRIVADHLVLTKFGVPVQFMNTEELFFANQKTYLVFDKFEISAVEANIVFYCKIEGRNLSPISVTLKKVGDNWNVTEKKQNQ